MFEIAKQHQFWLAMTGYWIFSAAVSAMPEPLPEDRRGYFWIYRFLHTLAGNISTALGRKVAVTAIIIILTAPLLLSASACAARYTIHPGALNKTDSAAYDALLVAEAAIDQGRIELQAGHLADGTKDPLNALIRSYNVTRASWLAYRGAIGTSLPSAIYFDQLNKDISALMNAIRAFKEVQ